MNGYTITLPIPNRVLSPNARSHWRVVAKAKAALRLHAKCVATVSDPPQWKRARVVVEWFTKTKRRPDEDNARSSLKAAFDGLQDAGILHNDRGLEHGPMVFAVDKANPRVVLTVTELK
jgi:crossover junction endodeoxyribonuclease RusA